MPAAPAAREGLRVRQVSRSFRGVAALRDVDLDVPPRTIVGLIGPNGAGKSSLVNIMSGYDRPDAGTVELDSRDITAVASHRRARLGLSRTFQHGRLYPGLSVVENIEVAALGVGMRAAAARSAARDLMERFGLAHMASDVAATLPHGVERRVGVARALATGPRYLLMDEPAAGLNEGEMADFAVSLAAVREDGIGVLLIDHNVRLILEVCDRIVVLVEGRNFLVGTPAELRSSDALAEAYLGRSGRAQAAQHSEPDRRGD